MLPCQVVCPPAAWNINLTHDYLIHKKQGCIISYLEILMLERGSLIFNAARILTPKEHRPAVRRLSYDVQDFVRKGVRNLVYYGTPDMFERACFESDTGCNFNRCWYCPQSIDPKGNDVMSDEVYQTMVEQLSKIGWQGFRGMFAPVFFGEPTMLGSKLVDMMDFARQRLPHAKIHIFTNGILLTPQLYTDLVRVGVDKIIVTRHQGASTRNIERLRAQASPQQLKRIVWDRNSDEITKLWNRGGSVTIPADRVLHLERCPMAAEQLTVDQKGNVLFCCNDYYARNQHGNIMERDIKTIWEDREFTKLRNGVRRGIYALALCRKCMDKE